MGVKVEITCDLCEAQIQSSKGDVQGYGVHRSRGTMFLHSPNQRWHRHVCKRCVDELAKHGAKDQKCDSDIDIDAAKAAHRDMTRLLVVRAAKQLVVTYKAGNPLVTAIEELTKALNANSVDEGDELFTTTPTNPMNIRSGA